MPLTRRQKKEAAQKATKVKVDKQSNNCIVDDSKFQEWCNLFHEVYQKMQADEQFRRVLYFACARYDLVLSEKSIN